MGRMQLACHVGTHMTYYLLPIYSLYKAIPQLKKRLFWLTALRTQINPQAFHQLIKLIFWYTAQEVFNQILLTRLPED